MPRFGKRSKERMRGIDVRLVNVLNELIKIMDVTIIEGVRSKERQKELLARGATKVKNSKHMDGKAVDLAPYPIDWNDRERFFYFAGWVLAKAEILRNVGEITHDIRWGGNWRGFQNGVIDFKKNTFDDLPHFELII